MIGTSEGGTPRTFPICKDHRNADWNQPALDGESCVLCRLFYLEAQEGLLEEWQQRAKRAEDAIAEVQRPLDAQMARLNATVVGLNARNSQLERELAEAQKRVAAFERAACCPDEQSCKWRSSPAPAAAAPTFTQKEIADSLDLAECAVHDKINDPNEREWVKGNLRKMRAIALAHSVPVPVAGSDAKDAERPSIPTVLFDGYAVYEAMGKPADVSPRNVAAVLDAVVRLIRAERK